MGKRLWLVVVLCLGAQAWAGEGLSSSGLSGAHVGRPGASTGYGRGTYEGYQATTERFGLNASTTHVYATAPQGWESVGCRNDGVCVYRNDGKTYYFINSKLTEYFKDGMPTSKWKSEGGGVYSRTLSDGAKISITFHPDEEMNVTAAATGTKKEEKVERSPNIIPVTGKTYEEFARALNGQDKKKAVYYFTDKENCPACVSFAPKMNKFADLNPDYAVFEVDATNLINGKMTGEDRANFVKWILHPQRGASPDGAKVSLPFVHQMSWSEDDEVWNKNRKGEEARIWIEEQTK